MHALIDPGSEGGALVLLGTAGIGKTSLMAELAGHARASGLRVLAAAGREQDSAETFAGLKRLLRRILAEHLGTLGRHASKLHAALGTLDVAEPDPSLAGNALLELPGGQAERVLVLVDDAHWMDTASLEALTSASEHSIGLVCAARGEMPPPGLQQGGVAELRIGPLDTADARELLQAQPRAPRGRARAEVLVQAAGNPLSLIELSKAITADPTEGRGWSGMPLPLTPRLGAVFAARLSSLPARTRHALLLIAVADNADLTAVTRAAPGLDAAALAPAEELGLITVDATGARFRDPLIRSAVYHDAPFAVRAAVHRDVAEVLRDQPDRQAWHLAAASLCPDETVASLLAATAPQARRRGGFTAMAAALERAADLSPEPADQARRLIAAAEASVSGGQTEWARDLAARALGLTSEADLQSRGQLVTGQALAWSGRPAEAAAALLPLASGDGAAPGSTAWDALALAATAAHQAGAPDGIQLVTDALAELPPPGDDETRAARLWALAVTGQTFEAGTVLRGLAPTAVTESCLSRAGSAAWLLDDTSRAIDLLRAARSMQTERGALAAGGGPLEALSWACLDAGRWDDALELATGACDAPETDISRSGYWVITATIEAARGETGHARALIGAALAAEPEHSRGLTARAWHALGLCALSDGDYLTAFEVLRELFNGEGTARHHHASYLAAGDLALAASRCGQRLAGREILKRITAGLGRNRQAPSPRLSQVLVRADGILADPATPGAYPDDVLDDPAGGEWPFEHAQLCLEFGEWLRRRRRINEAKPVLGTALEQFRALRARPWEYRTQSELRACGVTVPGTLADAARLRELTPQQRQVLGLAARGLSNREIAQRLFLSPRTVASHLYRSFPKLGVAGRHQLHLLFSQPGCQV
jgi:DNA-binding CsgD family transcriptional regulator/tetratricopeptide (TPR) repeat protein